MEEVNQYFEQHETPQYKRGQEAELMNFLNDYPWQAWLHGTAEPGTSFEIINEAVGAWRGRLAHYSRMQVASMGFFTAHPQPHVHVLLVGKNRFGRTLADLDEDSIEGGQAFWKVLMHRPAEFTILHDRNGAVDYVVGKNVIDKHAQFLSPRGVKLLQKIKINQ